MKQQGTPAAPKLVGHPVKGWEQFCEARTEAAYEALDNLFDDLGCNGVIDVVAGAFADHREHAVHARQDIIDAARRGERRALMLLGHERRHLVHGTRHPTEVVRLLRSEGRLRVVFPMLRHARRVGFTEDSASWLLRWHWSSQESRQETVAWLREA